MSWLTFAVVVFIWWFWLRRRPTTQIRLLRLVQRRLCHRVTITTASVTVRNIQPYQGGWTTVQRLRTDVSKRVMIPLDTVLDPHPEGDTPVFVVYDPNQQSLFAVVYGPAWELWQEPPNTIGGAPVIVLAYCGHYRSG